MILTAQLFPAQAYAISSDEEAGTDSMTVLDRISARLQQGDVFHAQMQHQFVDGFTGDEVLTEGEVWVASDGYKIITDAQHISVQDDVSTVYNMREQKVIISTYYPEDDDFAPSRLLGSYSDRFSITGVETPEEGYKRIILESTDPFEVITTARLLIDESSLLPVGMFAEDQTSNTYETMFSQGRYTTESEVDFSLDWPEQAEIIDLRE
jgi:hypothetical protein